MLPDENVYLQAKCTLDKDGVQEAATMDENKPVTAGVPDVVDLTLWYWGNGNLSFFLKN